MSSPAKKLVGIMKKKEVENTPDRQAEKTSVLNAKKGILKRDP